MPGNRYFFCSIVIWLLLSGLTGCNTGIMDFILHWDLAGRDAWICPVEPDANSVINRDYIMVTGEAHDNAGISRILVQVNNVFYDTVGTEAWSAEIPVAYGENNITVSLASADGTVPVTESYSLYRTERPLASMTDGRSGFAACSYNGKLYVAGGSSFKDNSSVLLDTIEEYDIDNDCWTYFCKLPSGLRGHAMVIAHDLLYILGGVYDDDNSVSDTCYVLDLKTRQWVSTFSLPSAKYYFECTWYADSLFILPDRASQSIYRYSLQSPGWELVWDGSLYPINSEPDAVLIRNKVYLTGGINPNTNFPDERIFVFNLDDYTVSRFEHPLPVPLSYTGVLNFQNRLLVLGGYNNGSRKARIYFYDFINPGWQELAPLSFKVCWEQAVINAERIYIIGGQRIYENTVELGEVLQDNASSPKVNLFQPEFDPAFD